MTVECMVLTIAYTNRTGLGRQEFYISIKLHCVSLVDIQIQYRKI